MRVPENVVQATTERFAERAEERAATEHKIDEVKAGHGSIIEVDSPDRVELRRRRVEAQPVANEVGPVDVPELLERVIDGSNLLGVAFLELGTQVAGTVGRVNIRDQFRIVGFGTGFMVAPRLLMTNNHVLEEAGSAAFSQVEFGLQNGLDGKPRPTTVFDLQPDTVFVTDQALDVTVVAVSPRSRPGGAAAPSDLADFGFNRLSKEQGKILLGECINIIQHPEGQPKQLALQQNELVDRIEHFLHYRSDTAPGSSGSPLFNNQWEVLGLHHSGVPAKDAQGRILAIDGTPWTQSMGEDKIKWIANEGIRISSVMAWLESQLPQLGTEGQSLVRTLLDARTDATSPPVQPVADLSPVTPAAPATLLAVPNPEGATTDVATSAGEVTVTIPVQVTVRIGAVSVGGDTGAVDATEAVSIDPDYSTRGGYDAQFTGLPVPLPVLTDTQRAAVAVNVQPQPGDDPTVLDYHHFSLVMHRARRIAWYTVVNIDGAISRDLTRERDKWILDPRIERDAQIGEALYKNNDFDRGHLVRRLDPAWGPDDQVAKVANDDTFHFTNCSPQHKNFNQNEALWAGLEDYILRTARAERSRLTVFNGPVLMPDDPVYRDVQIPLAFWKVLVFRTPEGNGSAAAFLISQRSLVEDLLQEAVFTPETFQVPVASIAELTTLDLDHLRVWDALEGASPGPSPVEESTQLPVPGVRLGTYSDLRF